MTIVDPHVFALNVADITDSVNELIADGLTMDGDDPADGNLDLNLVLVLRPLDQSAASGPMEVVFPTCTAPADTTSCTLAAGADVAMTTGTNMASDCLDAVQGTTGGYEPPVAATPGPCIVSEPEMMVVPLGGLMIPLIDAQVAGTYVGDPATGLATGLIRGFLTQEAADSALIPDDVALVGGEPITAILSDGDKDMGPNGEDGWWFYLAFAADVVPYAVAE